MRREDIRKERARERERERRLEAKDAHGFKKSKLTRDRDRDVSEKMALGQVRNRLSNTVKYPLTGHPVSKHSRQDRYLDGNQTGSHTEFVIFQENTFGNRGLVAVRRPFA